VNDLLQKWADYLPQFFPGLIVTLELTIVAILIGLPLGVLFALLSSSPRRAVRFGAITIVELGRGTPGLIVLYLVYFGLPSAGLTLDSFPSAALALGFSTAAYTSEIIRGGIRAVAAGQGEAAAALALSPIQQMRYVILPQAVRKVIPPLVGFTILLYQGTSLAFKISVPELTSRAYNIASITYDFAPALILAGLMYSAISLALVFATGARLPSE